MSKPKGIELLSMSDYNHESVKGINETARLLEGGASYNDDDEFDDEEEYEEEDDSEEDDDFDLDEFFDDLEELDESFATVETIVLSQAKDKYGQDIFTLKESDLVSLSKRMCLESGVYDEVDAMDSILKHNNRMLPEGMLPLTVNEVVVLVENETAIRREIFNLQERKRTTKDPAQKERITEVIENLKKRLRIRKLNLRMGKAKPAPVVHGKAGAEVQKTPATKSNTDEQ